MSIKIAPSILSADFLHINDEIKAIEATSPDWLHIDIMDGHFVPNLTFGPKFVSSLKKITSLPLDVHLMLDNPQSFIERFADAGADNITVHAEVEVPTPQLYEIIKKAGKSFGLCLKPDSPIDLISDYLDFIDILLIMTVYPGFGGQKFIDSMAPKIAQAYKLKQDQGYNYEIEVDGGLNGQTVKTAVECGATIIVAGEYIFGSTDYAKAVESLRIQH